VRLVDSRTAAVAVMPFDFAESLFLK